MKSFKQYRFEQGVFDLLKENNRWDYKPGDYADRYEKDVPATLDNDEEAATATASWEDFNKIPNNPNDPMFKKAVEYFVANPEQLGFASEKAEELNLPTLRNILMVAKIHLNSK